MKKNEDPDYWLLCAFKNCSKSPEVRENLEQFLLMSVKSGKRFSIQVEPEFIDLIGDEDFSDFGIKLFSCYINYFDEKIILGSTFNSEESVVKLAKLVGVEKLREMILPLLAKVSIFNEKAADVLINYINIEEVYAFLKDKAKTGCILKETNIERLFRMKNDGSEKAAELLDIVEVSECYLQRLILSEFLFHEDLYGRRART